MKRSEIATVLVWAAATCALTLALLLPQGAQAGDEDPAWQTIANPTLTVNGCTLRLAWAQEPDAATPASRSSDPAHGEAFVLTASNPTQASVQVPWSVAVTARAPTSPMSRVMPMPTRVWEEAGMIALENGQTRTIRLTGKAQPPAGTDAMATLGSGEQSIVALHLPGGKAAVRALDDKRSVRPAVAGTTQRLALSARVEAQ